MELIHATLKIYRFALLQSMALLKKNWGVIFAPFAYILLLWAAGSVLARLGMIGGMLLILAADGCMSSGLHLVENIVKGGRTNLQDGVRGFGVHLLEIVQISFILWIPLTIASRTLGSTPEGALVLLFIHILLMIFLNVVPELIYLGRAAGIESLPASGRFMLENWPEWLIPNLMLLVAGYALLESLFAFASPLPSPAAALLVLLVSGAGLAYLMIFRGVLFGELHGTNRRSRVYRYKTGHWS